MKFDLKSVILENKDFAVLHDVVYEVIERSLSEGKLLFLWNKIPDDIKLDALKWGMSDTEVREKIYVWFEKMYGLYLNFLKDEQV